jgi:hypothetical protein
MAGDVFGTARYVDMEDTPSGHIIAMDSAHGVFRLAKAFAFRLASKVVLSLCLRALWLAFL